MGVALKQGETLSWTPAYLNYVKSMIGIGLLGLPWAFARSGLVVGSIGLVSLAYLNWFTDMLCVRCVAHERAREYAELQAAEEETAKGQGKGKGKGGWSFFSSAAPAPAPSPSPSAEAKKAATKAEAETFGPWGVCYRSFGYRGQVVAVGMMVLGQIGVGIAYTDYIATFLSAYALTHNAWVGLLFVSNSLLCLFRPLGAVAYISALGLLVYVLVLGLIFYASSADIAAADGVQSVVLVGSLSGVGQWFGVALFSMEGVSTVLTVFDGMGGRDVGPIRSVITANYFTVIPLLMAVGVLGYLAYGSAVATDILYSFTSVPGLQEVALVSIGIILVLSFPIQMAPIFEVCDALTPERLASSWPLVRVGLVGVTALGAVVIPDVTTVIALTADIAFSYIAFIGPGLLYLNLRPLVDSPPLYDSDGEGGGRSSQLPSDTHDLIMAVVVIVTGVVGGVFGVIDTLAA